MLSSIQGGWLGKAMIHRSEHKKDYTIVNNGFVRNTALSDGAVRLLLFMLTCSDEFEFNARGLSSLLGLSLGAISDRVKELQEAGYIVLTPIRDKGKFGSFTWDVYETPCSNLPNTEKVNSVHSTEFGFTEHGNSEHIRNTNLKEISNERKIKKVPKKVSRFIKPSVEEIREYCTERNNQVDPQRFYDYYESNGWKVGKNPMKDWKAAVRTWERSSYQTPKAKTEPISENPFTRLRREEGYES